MGRGCPRYVVRFDKVEGIGNDFLLLDKRDEPHTSVLAELPRLRELAPSLCDRRKGVGADGLLVVGVSPSADATMWVINADGSQPEMCGNGLRCVAHVVAQRSDRSTLTISTDAGPKRCEIFEHHAREALVEVNMGPGQDLGFPSVAAAGSHGLHAVSMGNPHAIAFVDEDPEPLARTLGPSIETDAAFPQRTNVEFARLHAGPTPRIELWVWERGVGITQACGTGACATACAAVWSGRAEAGAPIAVDLPGGRLVITVPRERAEGVLMKGPSRVVYRGEIDC